MTVAFVLGGGGVRGAVEVGMLRALLEAGLMPGLIVGTSIGAINGAAVAHNPTMSVIDDLEQAWGSPTASAVYGDSWWRQMQRLAQSRTHLNDPGPLRELLASIIGADTTFADLAVPFAACAASIERASEVWFDSGPVIDAVLASASVPAALPPTLIDGEHYVDGALNKTLHASVALDEGVSLLICVNPLVPYDASSSAQRGGLTKPKLNQGGLPLVLGQTFRAIIHSRMKVGMEKYARQYPDASIMLFEPDPEDADMFFANIFSYRQRRRLCALAFERTRRNLLARADVLSPALARHGITLRMDRLQDPARSENDALTDPRPLHAQARGDVRRTARDLRHTLVHLERWLAGAH